MRRTVAPGVVCGSPTAARGAYVHCQGRVRARSQETVRFLARVGDATELAEGRDALGGTLFRQDPIFELLGVLVEQRQRPRRVSLPERLVGTANEACFLREYFRTWRPRSREAPPREPRAFRLRRALASAAKGPPAVTRERSVLERGSAAMSRSARPRATGKVSGRRAGSTRNRPSRLAHDGRLPSG